MLTLRSLRLHKRGDVSMVFGSHESLFYKVFVNLVSEPKQFVSAFMAFECVGFLYFLFINLFIFSTFPVYLIHNLIYSLFNFIYIFFCLYLFRNFNQLCYSFTSNYTRQWNEVSESFKIQNDPL